MPPYRVGIIGTGRPWKSEGASGFGMAHAHAYGYEVSPDAEIVAVADISRANAEAFQAEHGGAIYEDYHEMLRDAQIDIVSVCAWPRLHAPMVIAAAEAGVKAIHCEKPMAPTYGEARQMEQVCRERGVQLTFNHQRRFAAPFRKARELLQGGAIGQLQRIEGTCANLFDWGTHWFDMFFFYNDQIPAQWVLGQIEPSGGQTVFGIPVEGQGLSHWAFANGVEGLLMTRSAGGWPALNRLIGSEGTLELSLGGTPTLRVWGHGQSGWQAVDAPVEEGAQMREVVGRGVLDLIDALKTGREPELSGRKALMATELIFATYESSRQRGRVDLPLEIDDSPFLAMIGGNGGEAGQA